MYRVKNQSLKGLGRLDLEHAPKGGRQGTITEHFQELV